MTRLITYNILEGFRDGRGASMYGATETLRLNTRRLEEMRTFLAEAKPDILVLNEANWCMAHNSRRLPNIVFNYALELGFAQGVAHLWDDEWGNVILSNLPITSYREIPIADRSGIMAEIDINGTVVAVATYHPHPYMPDKKRAYETFVDSIIMDRLIVAGDFNSISPEDGILFDPYVAQLEKHNFPGVKIATGFITNSGIAGLTRRGLKDAVGPGSFTIPTRLGYQSDTGARIDHIFYRGKIVVDHAEVVQSDLTHTISDHYPVLMDFHIDEKEAS